MSDKQQDIDLIQKCCSAQSLSELHQLFSKYVENVGFKKYSYQLIKSSNYDSQKPLIISTYAPEWVNHYVEQDYTNIDPVIRKGVMMPMPFQWSQLWRGVEISKKQRRLFSEASDYGVSEGVGIPVLSHGGGKAMISLVSEESSDQTSKIFIENQTRLQLISVYYHHAVLNLCGNTYLNTTFNQDFNLTGRELDLLKWIAEGKTFPDIAGILGISENTVLFHSKNLYKKMGVSSRHEAVVKGLVSRLIQM